MHNDGTKGVVMSDKIVLLADGTPWQTGQEVFWPETFGENITVKSEVPYEVRWVINDEPHFSFKNNFIRVLCKPRDEMCYASYEAAYQVGLSDVENYLITNIAHHKNKLAEFERKYQEFKGATR